MSEVRKNVNTKIISIGRLQLRHKNRDPTPSWLISKTKLGQRCAVDRVFGLLGKISRRSRERKIQKKVSMCEFDPYETREYTKHSNQDGAR